MTNNIIISVLTTGYNKSYYFVIEMLKIMSKNKVLLLTHNDINFACNRLTMHYNSDFRNYVKYEEFDALIIEYFSEEANTQENIKFITEINEIMENKKVIILFKGSSNQKIVGLDDFPKYKDVIQKNSSEIYTLNMTEKHKLEILDLSGNVVKFIKK